MNILFLSSDYPPNLLGGVGMYTHQFSRHLTERGHQAFVITETDGGSCEYVDRGVHVFRIRHEPIRWFDSVRHQYPELVRRVEYSIAVARQIKTLMQRFRIDVVESCESRAEGFWHYLFHRKPALFIKLHTPDRIIFPLNQRAPSADVNLMLMLEEWWLRRATRLVGLTHELTHRVGKLFSLRVDQVPYVKVPVDTHFFHPNMSLKSNRDLRVLYVGRMEFRKGIHVLLRAIPRVLETVRNVQFTFMGPDSGMRSLLSAYLTKESLQGHIHWKESATRQEIREAYQRSHVCVVPSLWENHPTVCLEAMSCASAVVASRVGGIPEIVRHDEDGMLVPPGSSYALARTVTDLLLDAKKRERLGAHARAHMEKTYDTRTVFDETIQVYQQCLAL